MLDAFIIEEIVQRKEIERQEKGRRQPYLPIPDRMPYEPLQREGGEAPRREYWRNEDKEGEGEDGCVIIDMKSLRSERYIV